jgi:hypothetical protein
MHDDDLPAAGRGTTESRVEGNASIGRKAADERSDQQDAGVRRIDEIKAYPVVGVIFSCRRRAIRSMTDLAVGAVRAKS